MMKKSDKFAISSITVCYAEITNLPQDYLHSSGTQISFDHVKDNEVKVSFDFQNSSFSEQEAFRFAMCETYKITYSINFTRSVILVMQPAGMTQLFL
jgi:hypothetical protein